MHTDTRWRSSIGSIGWPAEAKWIFGGGILIFGAVGLAAGGLDERVGFIVAPHALTLAVWGAGYLLLYVKKFGDRAPLALIFSWSMVEVLFNGEYSLYSWSWILLPNLFVALAVCLLVEKRIRWKETWRKPEWISLGAVVLTVCISPLAWYFGVDAFSSPVAEVLGDLPALVLVVVLAE